MRGARSANAKRSGGGCRRPDGRKGSRFDRSLDFASILRLADAARIVGAGTPRPAARRPPLRIDRNGTLMPIGPRIPDPRRRPRYPPPARRAEPELLDQPDHDPAELRDNLRDIRRVNRFGGARVVLDHLPRLLDRVPPERPVAILDLGTGAGDIPLAVARRLREIGRPFRLVASDVDPAILDIARDTLGHLPEVSFARYDARAVPLPDGAFNVVLCSLALHHFAPDDAVAVLREMRRLARAGFILNDLRRSRAGHLAALAASRLATRNRLTRHDMPLSVRRAYTPAELADLLARAGIDDAEIRRHPLFRMAALWLAPPDAAP
jgi:ubiquinone/menaquinone biosynthesis C-methylase UbiE